MQLYEHMSSLLHVLQLGFLKGDGITLQLTKITHNMAKASAAQFSAANMDSARRLTMFGMNGFWRN